MATMTRDELTRALSAIEHTLDTRVDVWRIITDEIGKELGRVYRGSFTAPRDFLESRPSGG